jgi:glycosyltransferase involved in cell wall biosynthesis
MNVADDRIFNRNNNNHRTAKNNNTFDLFYHGAIVQRYGIDLVLEAIAHLRNDIPQINFTIHGQSEYKEFLVKLAAQLDISNRVHFTNGFLPIAELPELICRADVAVVPYRSNVFTEGILPTKLMEYTALGIPAIVARTPAIEAYFSDSMVEYFPAGDVDALISSIRRLYQDRERLQSLVKHSDQFNQCYNWSKHSGDYLALVNKLADSQRRLRVMGDQ